MALEAQQRQALDEILRHLKGIARAVEKLLEQRPPEEKQR